MCIRDSTYSVQANALRVGNYVMLKGHPCKVMEVHFFKVGKHGHAKASIVGIDIFTSKKYEDTVPSTHNIAVPFVTRKEYQLNDIASDGFMALLRDDGATKDDLRLGDSSEEVAIKEKLEEMVNEGKVVIVGVIEAMGTEKIVDYREF
eukprot:TRINITY_DN197_c0_g3_i1.p2 TRINITY_DN197_c0_g3~~TRINITY_DN197_c0_g3_i1.p2  ORF type:complete len:148 (-),score=49.71 TRINITY_DN197_c0_g3_i1:35-478(-)